MSENQSEKKQEILEAPDVEVEEKEKEQVRQVVAEVIRSEFSGPIPPPSIIKGYEEILPGSADRILAMAEKQSDQRKIVNTEARDSLLGILFAFMLGLGCILAAVVMVILVPKSAGVISGAVLGVTGIGSIIATFIKSTRGSYGRKKEERKNQNSENSI